MNAERETKGDLPVFGFKSQRDWEAWLEENHTAARGLWLKLAKKGSGIPSVTYPEALETALCYGWIDGQKAPWDDQFWLQRFSPRRPNSRWSRVNCEKAAALIAEGRMKPAGLKEVAEAKADGRWDAAYASQRTVAIPADLQEKLAENPRAQEFFAGLDSRNRYAILYRIEEAKRPETRVRRIDKYMKMLNEGKKIY